MIDTPGSVVIRLPRAAAWFRRPAVLAIALVVAALLTPSEALATHSYGAHFRVTGPETRIDVADCVTAPWDVYLRRFAIPHWSHSPRIDMHLVRCSNPRADVVLRSRNYDFTPLGGWFRAWTDANGDRTRVQIRLNNYWLRHLSPRRLRHTLCHELGHALGLEHRDGLTSCMRTGKDIVPSPRPDAHDYEQIGLLYAPRPAALPTPPD